MDIWLVPNFAVFSLIALFLYLGLLSRRLQRVAFNIADHLAQKQGSGISRSSVGGFCKSITPTWVRVLVWVSSLAALALMVYVAKRYGWPWALAYAIGDHVAKSVEIPIFPTIDQSYSVVEKQAERVAPAAVYQQVTAYRSDYVHE